MYAYKAWNLFTNLETFSILIDFQKKCYGKYTSACKVVSREINHSVNCMYYRRLFGAKWKISRVTCSLKYEGLHLSIFATICNTSPYLFEFSPFVWHLTQFFWCDNVCIYSMGLIYKLGDFLHINWFSEEVLW